MRLRLAFALLLGLLFALPAVAKRHMSFEDLYKVKILGSPRLSPDGRQILFTVTTADWDANRRITQIWRVASDGSDLRQLTRQEKGATDPRWSPDGSFVAFRSARDGKTQIYLMYAQGGEPWKLTNLNNGVQRYQWGPDGDWIYALAPDTLSPRERERKEEKLDAYDVDGNLKPVHLWRFRVADGKAERLTSGPFSIRSFQLSPHGKRVAFIAAPSPLRDADIHNEIYLLSLATGNVRQITRNKAIERSLAWVPDGSALTFVSDSNEKLETYYQESIFRLDLETGQARDLLPGFPWQVYTHFWTTRKGKPDRIVFLANTGVATQFFELNPKSGKWRRLTSFQGVFSSPGYRDSLGRLVFLRTDPQHPYDVFLADLKKLKSPVQITHFNAWVDTLSLASYSVIHWLSTDGKEVEGILITPPDYDPERRYPLVLQIHGGPESSYKLQFSTSWVRYPHVLAGKGYVILEPNYRGSTGYGDDWMRAIIGHYFEKDFEDLMSGVDAMMARGVAHPDSLVIHGWSAGGHETNWAVTHTDIFQAAASGAGGADWLSFYAQTDMHYIREIWHASVPYENWQFWLKKSPVLYVKKASTPTLIFCGENDQRVPFPQSKEMYVGLKRYGCPVEFVAFPREGHGLRELRHQWLKMKKEFNWFEHYLRGARLLSLDEIETPR